MKRSIERNVFTAALRNELKWCRKHLKDMSGCSTEYKHGFMAGLRQSRFLFNRALKCIRSNSGVTGPTAAPAGEYGGRSCSPACPCPDPQNNAEK